MAFIIFRSKICTKYRKQLSYEHYVQILQFYNPLRSVFRTMEVNFENYYLRKIKKKVANQFFFPKLFRPVLNNLVNLESNM